MPPKEKQSKSGAKQEEPDSEDIPGEEEIDEEFDEEEVRPKGVAVGGAGIRREAEEGDREPHHVGGARAGGAGEFGGLVEALKLAFGGSSRTPTHLL